MQKKSLFRTFTVMALLFVSFVANAQETLIKGNVISATDNEAVIGLTVREKGTRNATVTDMDGNFSIKVSNADATLEFSYIGFVTQSLRASNGMKVIMRENTQALEELVVVGYQTQRKADLTGAVAVMDMKSPSSESDPNVLNSMQGKLAGVNIITDASPGGGSTAIRVRGMSTVNNNDPLYIIDGVATSENLNSVNAADIESIQVLKDASSASIYGSRAANGVIIITTKHGKGNKLNVNINYSASLQTVAKTYKMLNATQWGEVYWAANKNAGIKPSHPFYGSGDVPQLVQYLDANGTVKSANTDWQKEVYSPAWTQNLTASVSNSSEKGTVLFSGNYINQDGLMDYTYYRRFTARLNSTYNISKYVSVGENMMLAKWFNRGYTTSDDRGIPYTAMRQHPAIPVYDNKGNFTSPMVLAGSDINNPINELYNGRDNDNHSWRIFGNAYLEIYPVKGLTLKSNIGIEHVQYLNKILSRKILSSDMNSVTSNYGEGDTYTWTNTANYILNLNRNNNFTFLAGTEAIKYSYEGLSAFRNNYAFEDEDYMQIDAGEGAQTNGGNKQEWALFSLFGKIDYNYAERYLLSATLRNDATSRLNKDNNSGVFPALSGAWRLSEEKFFHKTKYVTNAKIRIGWGQNGNSAINNNYASYTTYAYDTGNDAYDINGTNTDVNAGVKVVSSGNKKLKWETTTQTNLGIDLGLFNDAVNFTFDYYWKKTKNMLTIPPVLSVEGENAAMYMNTGDMDNHGWEINMSYNSSKYGDFSWNGSLNLSSYRNKVVKLNDFVSSIGGDYRLIEGQPMGVYYGYVCDGIFQNSEEVSNWANQQGKGVGRLKFRDIDGSGTVDENDRTVIGDPNPDLSLGLNLSFTYKNLTLSTFFSGDFGFDIYNTTKKQLDFMSYGGSSTNRGVEILNAWTETNTNASIPMVSVVDNNNEARMSTFYIEDGSYLKMKYIKLQYQLPNSMIRKLNAQSLCVYAQMENIFTITGYDGLDPEVPLAAYGARLDVGPYPRARTFTLGVNLSF